MSGSIIHTPAVGADWPDAWQQVEYSRKGMLGLSLTNYDALTLPQIASGSWAEVAGSIYKWTANDTISGSPSSGNINYIKLVPGGSGESAYVTPTWTTSAPTWSDAYQGWYSGTSRYVAGCYYDGTNYAHKFLFDKGRNTIREFTLEIGDWNMDTTENLSIAHGLGNAYKNIRGAYGSLRDDTDTKYFIIPCGVAAPQVQFWGNTGSSYGIDSTNITLNRAANGDFDDAQFDSTSFNRGWVIIQWSIV